jgi:DNA-directed RNA polymerase specialized sigma24 family protein
MEDHTLRKADPARGKFRAFLLTALRHFLINEWEHARAQKRGGGARLVPLDIDTAETRYGAEAVDNANPERLFEQEWARTLLEGVLDRLKAVQEKDGKLHQFNALRGCLMGDPPTPYSELAVQLHTTEGALKMAVCRLRRQYGKLLREAIAETVERPDQVEEEIQHLLAVLGGY